MWIFFFNTTKENMELIIIAVNRWFLCEDAAFYSHVFRPPEAERFRPLEPNHFFFFFKFRV